MTMLESMGEETIHQGSEPQGESPAQEGTHRPGPAVAGAVVPHSGAGLPGGQLALCPYCGHRQSGRLQCERCRGLFEPLSRQATQNAMGPWYIRDETNPFRPGCSFEKLRELASKGFIRPETVIRGPTTRQFWTLACNTPGVAALLGECHACHVRVSPDDYMCKACGAVLGWSGDRQHLGLTAIKLLPGQAPAKAVATSGMLSTPGEVRTKREDEHAPDDRNLPKENETSEAAEGIETDDQRPAVGAGAALVALIGAVSIVGAIAAAVFMGPNDVQMDGGVRQSDAALVEPAAPRNH